MTSRFDDDMIVLEKWNPNKPLSAIYWDGDKERFYVKRFLIEQGNREDLFISEHQKSYLELVSTDWRPVVELEYSKPRGKDAKPNLSVDIEDFITIKGIKALGNQLTSDKVKNINVMNSLPYEEPEEQVASEIEVVDEEDVSSQTAKASEKKPESTEDPDADDEGQITLF